MTKTTKEFITYEDIIKSGFVKEKTETEKIIDLSRSLRAEYRQTKDTDISSIAYDKLREIGFNNTLGTLYLADIIEDLYSERILLRTIGENEYFDLSYRDNLHYKYIYDRYRINDPYFYRGAIAIAISRSKCDCKNINEIAYGVLDGILKSEKTLKLK